MDWCAAEEAVCGQLLWLQVASQPGQSAALTSIRHAEVRWDKRLPPARHTLQREPGLRNKLQLCGRRQPVDGGGFTVAASVQLTAQNGCTSGLPAVACLRCFLVPVLPLEAQSGKCLQAREPPRPHPALCAVQEEAQWVPGTDHFVSGQGHYTQVSGSLTWEVILLWFMRLQARPSVEAHAQHAAWLA